MSFAALEALLHRAIGLDASTIGTKSVERAVRERMRVSAAKTVEDYEKLTRDSVQELQELVETVVVPETWFFRDPGAFAALEQMVAERLAKKKETPLRALSLPCSTGEEPYSISIALLRAGAKKFTIDAVDISRKSLDKARQGSFGKNSFRGTGLEFRDRFFTQEGSHYSITLPVKERVRFLQGNLLEGLPLPVEVEYDFIFCRNLLIYFDVPTRDKVFQILSGKLAENGALFVGPSESGVAAQHGFTSTKIPLSFAFRKSGPPPVSPPSKPAVKTAPLPPRVAAPTASSVRPAVIKEKTKSAASLKAAKKEHILRHARQFADQGKLQEAGHACEDYLKEFGPSPDIYYLLGLVRDAGNQRDEARDYYRKALYLQPDHYEALVHLSVLTRSLGDAAGARTLQERAERASRSLVDS